MKVIHLIPGKPPRITDKGVKPKALFEFFGCDSDHITLLGLEHVGKNLGLFVKGRLTTEPMNVEAMKIAKYLKWSCEVDSKVFIRGPAVLYNDDGDMTEEIWASVYEVIRLKKQKTIPIELAEKLQQLKKEYEDNPPETEAHRIYMELFLPKAEQYGLERK